MGIGACSSPSKSPDFSTSSYSPPNLIFVLTDEHPAKAWSRGGVRELKTPNLERLADEGITFTNCISNNPICTPYRASLLTGLHGHQNGFINNHDKFPLANDLPTWSQILKDQGYTMGYIGKWHLYPACEAPIFEEGEVKTPAQLTPPAYRQGFDDLWIQTSNHNEPFNTYYWDEDEQYKKYDGYAPTHEMTQLLGFIDTHQNDSTPFCAVLSLLPPHPIYSQAPRQWRNYYQHLETPFWRNVPGRYRTYENLKGLKDFYAQITAVDAEIGRLLDKLDKTGLAENTVVVFTSDHGDLHYAHGNYWKRYPWEESVNVPFIARFPVKIKPKTISDALLGAVDLAPTLLGLLGFGDFIPPSMQGNDLSHVFFGQKGHTPVSQLILYNLPPAGHYIHERQPDLPDYRGVRTKEWTYAVRKLPITGEVVSYMMHHNLEDPYQLKNLIDDPLYADQRLSLHEALERHLGVVGEEGWLENTPKDMEKYTNQPIFQQK